MGYVGMLTYLLYGDLEMELSDGLAGGVGEHSPDENLARRVGHAANLKVHSKLGVKDLDLV